MIKLGVNTAVTFFSGRVKNMFRNTLQTVAYLASFKVIIVARYKVYTIRHCLWIPGNTVF